MLPGAAVGDRASRECAGQMNLSESHEHVRLVAMDSFGLDGMCLPEGLWTTGIP